MQITRANGWIQITCVTAEAENLAEILERIVYHYQVPPADVDPRVAAAWYSTRGCVSAGFSQDDTQAWIAELHEGKRSVAGLLKRCLIQLRQGTGPFSTLSIRPADAVRLITALNDHRLQVAAVEEFGETEMSIALEDALAKWSPARCRALLQIHILGALMEQLLSVVAPECIAPRDLL